METGKTLYQALKGKKAKTTGSGIGKPGGSEHYRAYVGPPHYYDLMAAMAFNLVTICGLRQHHRFLDIGCGSLRMGRLLIPYLNPENYLGVEPNRWLVEDGILNELGNEALISKAPSFIFDTTLQGESVKNMDYAMAQSIFTHCAKDQIEAWLDELYHALSPSGVLFATYFDDDKDYEGSGWIYPDCSRYRPETMRALVEDAGFGFRPLDWVHPRKQRWFACYRSDFDARLIEGPVTWNRYIGLLPPG